jgi:hypothetical protein
MLACGCAQFKAMDQPKPFKPTATVVGAKRVSVAGELGSPIESEESNGRLVDTYKYVDGGGKNSTGSKVTRVVLYTGADVFTLFLAQLITWPTETAGFAGTTHVVTVEFEKGPDGFWRATSVSDVDQTSKTASVEIPKAQSPKAKAESPPAKPEVSAAKTDSTKNNSSEVQATKAAAATTSTSPAATAP